MSAIEIERLGPSDAEGIVDCFRRVYGDSYANPVFQDAAALAALMSGESVNCVGALRSDRIVVGHMAMTLHPGASSAELGNTVVDPQVRGEGVAWKVGAELSKWCIELGYSGFLHYPTTAHHIMQRQSVVAGFETGLMLGYIPVETDGKVTVNASELRQAATAVE